MRSPAGIRILQFELLLDLFLYFEEMSQEKDNQLESFVAAEIEEVIQLRRRLHQIPELAYQEFETSRTLIDFIKDVPGVEIESGIAGTGIVATLGREKTGRCVAFRADMDALPIKEETGLPYASQNEGRMHACGHDGHSAILAGLLRVLARCSDQLKGPVKFVFQPAEEGGAGAQKLVDHGVLQNPKVDAMFGLHGWPTIELGKVGTKEGAFFASTNIFDIRIQGKGGHAAYPHLTLDPMPAAAAIVQALQTLVSRTTDPLAPSVLSICEIKGGSTYNVIPEQLTMKGTLRCFSEDHRAEMLKRIVEMTETVAAAYGASANVVIRKEAYPVLNNDEALVAFWKSVASDTMGESALVDAQPTMGAEDFAFYAEKVPSCFWVLGVKDPEAADWPHLHTPTYNFNDEALAIGIRLQAEAVLAFQE